MSIQSDVQFVAVQAAVSGNNTLIAAVAGRKIRVLAAVLVATTAVTAKFQSAAGGTDISGAMPLGANGTLVLPLNTAGWFETASGALLNLVLGGAIAVAGSITYVLVETP